MGRELAVKPHHDVHLEMEMQMASVIVCVLAFHYQHVTRFP